MDRGLLGSQACRGLFPGESGLIAWQTGALVSNAATTRPAPGATMAESRTVFLAPASIHAAYHKCITDSCARLTMVMPWFTPSPQLKDTLYGMLERGVSLTLVTRPPSEAKSRQHDESLAELLERQRRITGRKGFLGFGREEERDLVELIVVKNVHAKMVVQDEEQVVVSSSNLNTMSIGRNTEYGILSREKSVVNEALKAVAELRATDRGRSTTRGEIRRCGCGGWVFEPDHTECWKCFRSRNPVGAREAPEEDGEDESVEAEPTSGVSAPMSKPLPTSAAPSDKTTCPNCGGPKSPTYPLCRNCYRGKSESLGAVAESGSFSPTGGGSEGKAVCPRCGKSKDPRYPVCRDCYYQERK